MNPPSVDAWLAEAKTAPEADLCGMYLVHNGVVRITPKRQAREGIDEGKTVVAVNFSYDEEGLAKAIEQARTYPGVHYVRVWLNTGKLAVGDTLMVVLIGADIRPNCIDALQKLVGTIKNELVIEQEAYA